MSERKRKGSLVRGKHRAVRGDAGATPVPSSKTFGAKFFYGGKEVKAFPKD